MAKRYDKALTLAQLASVRDEEIDFSDIPEADDAFFKVARVVRYGSESSGSDVSRATMDLEIERMVRDRAYAIWNMEGQPAGRDVEHWLRAAQEIAAEERQRADQGADRGSRRPRAPRSKSAVSDSPGRPRDSRAGRII